MLEGSQNRRMRSEPWTVRHPQSGSLSDSQGYSRHCGFLPLLCGHDGQHGDGVPDDNFWSEAHLTGRDPALFTL